MWTASTLTCYLSSHGNLGTPPRPLPKPLNPDPWNLACLPAGALLRYLSEIREWCVECSCDMLFISIRTDASWYRLRA